MEIGSDTLGAVKLTSVSRLKNLLGIIIAIFAVLLYAQSISFNYTVDDGIIKDNNVVKQGVSAIPTLLKTDRLYGCGIESLRMPEYRPFTMIVFAIEWQLFPDSSHVYHLINILLYSLTCWLLYLLLCKLFAKQNLIFPFICTLLYTAHPIHTEVVDSIKSQDEILCFLFSLLSIILYLKFVETKRILHFIFASLFYLVALMSKETAITFLLICPLTIYFFTDAKSRDTIKVALILFVVSALFMLIRYEVFQAIPATRVDKLISPDFNSIVAVPDFISQKATVFYILLRYIFLLILPYHLSYDYSIAQIPTQHIYSVGALFGIAVYLLIGIVAILNIKKKSIAAFAILFYLITIVPVSNVFLLIHWTMAERFIYMPSLGFCMILALLIIKFTKTETDAIKFATLKQMITSNVILFVVVFSIVALYVARTLARNPDWKDNAALYSHDVKEVPNNAYAHLFYGKLLVSSLFSVDKTNDQRTQIADSAIVELTRSTQLYPIPEAYSYLGAAYLNKGDYANAIINYEMAIKLYFPNAPVYVYCDLGLAYSQTGNYDKALNVLETSLKYYPTVVDANIKKSRIYLLMGRNREAVAECERALKVDANNVLAYENMGCAYLNSGQYDNAIQCLKKALLLSPDNADCLRFLGMCYDRMDDKVTANQYYQKAGQRRD